MEEILIGIGNYGFPILISAYLLIRMENKLDGLCESINELSKIISKSN